jgi:hypothetical protein
VDNSKADPTSKESNTCPTDLIIDRSNLDEAEREIQASVPGRLRFGLDAVGRETATWCQKVLAGSRNEPGNQASVASTQEQGSCQSHLVGLTGLPKEAQSSVVWHKLPIKLFHTNPEIGQTISGWLEALLARNEILLPEVEVVKGGLEAVNGALDRLRQGDASGKRLVVKLSDETLE